MVGKYLNIGATPRSRFGNARRCGAGLRWSCKKPWGVLLAPSKATRTVIISKAASGATLTASATDVKAKCASDTFVMPDGKEPAGS